MSAITGDTLPNLGGALNDYSPCIDATTDLPAAAGNTAMADVAAMTRTRLAVWAELTTNGTGAPALTAHAELWGAVPGIAIPVVARTAVGTFTITYPSSVQDELPSSAPGYVGPVPLNLRAAWGQGRSGTVQYSVQVIPISPNVLSVYVFTGGALADTSGLPIDVMAI